MSSIKIYFDLDGTVYDLYNIPNWLEILRNENPDVYIMGKKLFSDELYKVAATLMRYGVKFGVITWGSMVASPEFEIESENAKRQWVNENLPFVESFVYQQYGTPKQQAIKNRTKNDILIDDNSEVLKVWINNKTRTGYQVTKENNVVDILKEILKQFE
jgi:hypothetical protein